MQVHLKEEVNAQATLDTHFVFMARAGDESSSDYRGNSRGGYRFVGSSCAERKHRCRWARDHEPENREFRCGGQLFIRCASSRDLQTHIHECRISPGDQIEYNDYGRI